MDEFTLSAFARYAGGCSRDPFAEVSSRSLSRCFAAMATKVADWLSQAISDGGAGAPQGIELTLEWSGAAAPMPASEGPEVPSGSVGDRRSPARRTLRRITPRRLGCREQTAVSVRSTSAGLIGARS